MEALRQDPGLVPVVSMEAAAPDSSQFSWKDYYRRALLALDEPLIEQKLTSCGRMHPSTVRRLRQSAQPILLSPGIELRLGLESALILSAAKSAFSSTRPSTWRR